MAPELHEYRCSGDMPAAHVDCPFVCDTFDEAMDHFEATSHAVDERCIAVDCDDPYHTATYSDIVPNEHPSYRVTLADPNDPGSDRTLVMTESEVIDTYPHWGGKLDIVSVDGVNVHIEARS
jgi:hypothetical protein